MPTPPLAPTKANTSPVSSAAVARRDAVDRGLQLGGVSGAVRNSVTPARIASSISAGSSVAGDDHDAGRRMLPAQHADGRRHASAVAHVEDDDVGLRRAGCARAASSSSLQQRDAHAARLQQLLELTIAGPTRLAVRVVANVT